jgi:hypothetical protein
MAIIPSILALKYCILTSTKFYTSFWGVGLDKEQATKKSKKRTIAKSKLIEKAQN